MTTHSLMLKIAAASDRVIARADLTFPHKRPGAMIFNLSTWNIVILRSTHYPRNRYHSSRPSYRYFVLEMSLLLLSTIHLSTERRTSCLACQGHRIGQIRKRRAFSRLSANVKRSQTKWGCRECDVALCNLKDCWYIYHDIN